MKKLKEEVWDPDGEVHFYSQLICEPNTSNNERFYSGLSSVLKWFDRGGAISNHNAGLAFELAQEVLDEQQ